MSETIPPSPGADHNRVSDRTFQSRLCLPAACCRRWCAAIALVVVAWWRSRKEDTGGRRRAPGREIGWTLLIALPGLTLPFVIRFAVVRGIATATEVSTVGVVYTALLGLLVYRQFDWRRIYPLLVETVALTGAVMLIVGTATAMAWALTSPGSPTGWSRGWRTCRAAALVFWPSPS